MYEDNDIFSSYWEHQMWQTVLGSYFILIHHTCPAPKWVLVFSCRGQWLDSYVYPLGPSYISARILSWTKIFFCNLMTRARNRASPEIYTFLKDKEYKQSSWIFICRKSFLQVCTKYEKITFEPERGWCYLVAWRWEQFWNISKIASILCHKPRTKLKEKSQNEIW